MKPVPFGPEILASLTRPSRTARVAYGPDPLQFADLRLPGGSGPHPVALVIHGGCWRAEYGIDHIGALAEAIAASGVATWAVEYRRVGNPGGGWPGTFDDLRAARAKLDEVAAEHGLDVGRVVGVGHSAGGQLALWLAAEGGLDAVVSLAGVHDLRRAVAEGCCDDMALRLVGDPARFAEASPQERLPLGVPQHLVHGALDDTVPVDFSRAYAEAARAAGDPVELTVLQDAGHYELVVPGSVAWPVVREAVNGLL